MAVKKTRTTKKKLPTVREIVNHAWVPIKLLLHKLEVPNQQADRFYLIETEIDLNLYGTIVGQVYEGLKTLGLSGEEAAAYIQGITVYMTTEPEEYLIEEEEKPLLH